jgi:multidrug efflux system outer membrane protein
MKGMKTARGWWKNRQARQVIARALLCGVLLGLPACGIPGYRPAMPAQGMPGGYPASPPLGNTPASSAQVGLKDFFQDPLLVALFDQALTWNQRLKTLDEDVQIARNAILARQGGFLPLMGFQGGASLEKFSRFTLPGASRQDDPYIPPDKFLPNPLPDYRLGVNLLVPLDIWRALRNARDAAVQRYYSAIERRNYFVTRLVADIADNYYGLIARDKRLENLDRIIQLQERSREVAEAKKNAGRGTELAVQRFLADVRRYQSEKLIVQQEIVEVENNINFLVGRFPQHVARTPMDFIDFDLPALRLGFPSQLLLNRADIREAEREVEAAGLDVKVARARFFPAVTITGSVGYEAFNPKYLFWTPTSLVGTIAGEVVAPLINKRAIQADYMDANARQLQAVYEYQRVILDAFTQVITRMSAVENYRNSIEIRKQQLRALEESVRVANDLYQLARIEYTDVLFAQRDLTEARRNLIDTKLQQLSAVINTYQALGGGLLGCGRPDLGPAQPDPNFAQPQQGAGDPSRLPELPAPQPVPDGQVPAPGEMPAAQLPAPGQQPEMPPLPRPAPPGGLPERSTVPGYLPSLRPTEE